MTPAGPAKLGPDDFGYHAVVGKRFNRRFAGSPDYVQKTKATWDPGNVFRHALSIRAR